MTELSTDELRENFDHFDSDSDGRLELEEFGRLMEALGGSATSDDVLIGFREIDTDGSGVIEFDEFASWFASR